MLELNFILKYHIKSHFSLANKRLLKIIIIIVLVGVVGNNFNF